MGFLLMIGAMILGICFIVFGISRRENKLWLIIFIVLGIVLVGFSIYLGLPK